MHCQSILPTVVLQIHLLKKGWDAKQAIERLYHAETEYAASHGVKPHQLIPDKLWHLVDKDVHDGAIEYPVAELEKQVFPASMVKVEKKADKADVNVAALKRKRRRSAGSSDDGKASKGAKGGKAGKRN